MNKKSNRRGITVAMTGGVLIALILIFGTVWTGHKAKQDTENAVNSVSLFYLDELAGGHERSPLQAYRQ